MDVKEFSNFVRTNNWVFAKTYVAFAPHEYVMRFRSSDKNKFDEAKQFIQDYGIRMFYYKNERKYLFFDGWFYWAMWNKDDPTDAVINRCKPEDYDIVFMKRGTQASKSAKALPQYVQGELNFV